jgi:glycosyltransferase involved in cell wall biosynthesis
MNQDKENNHKKQPLVSVIIPCYNGEKFIAEAIESVINQTYENWELIIVDDGSTDNSKEIVKKYLSCKRIQYIKHEENQGIPFARNTGIKASKGQYIALLDQDDLWISDKLKIQIDIFNKDEDKKIGLIFSDFLSMSDGIITHGSWPSRRVPKNIDSLSITEVARVLFVYNFIPTVTVLIRKHCFDNLGLLDDNFLGGTDDYEFFIRLTNNYQLKYVDYPLAIRRFHDNNFSKMERFFKDEIYIIDKTITNYNQLKDLKKIKLANLYYKLGRTHQIQEDFRTAKKNFIKAIKYNPLNVRYLFLFMICQFGCFGNFLLKAFTKIKRSIII